MSDKMVTINGAEIPHSELVAAGWSPPPKPVWAPGEVVKDLAWARLVRDDTEGRYKMMVEDLDSSKWVRVCYVEGSGWDSCYDDIVKAMLTCHTAAKEDRLARQD